MKESTTDTTTNNESEKNKYTNTAVYSIYALKCLANHYDIETTQTVERLRQAHYDTAYTYWLRENRNITGIVKKGFIPKKHHVGHKASKVFRRMIPSWSRKMTDKFDMYQKIVRNNGIQLNITIKHGNIYDMNADVIVNNASIDCDDVLSWKGSAGYIRDRIAYNKNDLKVLLNNWEQHWNHTMCRNLGRVGLVVNEKNEVHRFHSLLHPPYFLIHAGLPKPMSRHRFDNEIVMNNPNRFFDIKYSCYNTIFDIIYNYNISHTQLITSVAIPPLGIGVHNTYNTNTAAHCLCKAINVYKRKMNHNLCVYIVIEKVNDKDIKAFVEDLKTRLDRMTSI